MTRFQFKKNKLGGEMFRALMDVQQRKSAIEQQQLSEICQTSDPPVLIDKDGNRANPFRKPKDTP
jgi:hypothetical protein